MASKERIQRLKDETRCNILSAAFQIVKNEGWQALSMRKIADAIEYTAPIIYEYFSNKDALLEALTKQGYVMLLKELETAKAKHRLPAKQLESMWMAYWNFAFAEKEMYQLMYGVEMNCCCTMQQAAEIEAPAILFSEVIGELMKDKDPSEDDVCMGYYTYWSVVHGLVSINIVNRGTSDEINRKILKDTIGAITRSMTG